MASVTRDWRGTPITVGSTVVYPSRQGSSLWMNEGEVVSIDKLKEGAWQKGNASVRIGVKKKDSSRTSYPDVERITVIPE